jgi:PhzF family phenazine biosynthesis protein
MILKLYQADAFTEKLFGGNPAAVCILENGWLPDETLQKIAMENNLAETAFLIKEKDRFQIRWFTPAVEVDLCGHATLASAHILFEQCGFDGEEIIFMSPRSGELRVKKNGTILSLNFPVDPIQKINIEEKLYAGLGIKPVDAYKGKTDYMLVFNSEKEIRSIAPDFEKIKALAGRGLIITAKGDQSDFVSRFFAPQAGINEDPVTGSAHTSLTPYWSKVLNKKEMTAIQLSERKGYLTCKLLGERVEISGKAVTYLKGEITI